MRTSLTYVLVALLLPVVVFCLFSSSVGAAPITGYTIAISPTSTATTPQPTCSKPVCIGGYDTGKVDDHMCPLFACSPQPACPVPACDGAFDTGKKDANSCAIYACPPSTVCSAPACNGAYDTGKKDANNCELYACPPTPACSKPACDGSYDTGTVDNNNCPIVACPPQATCPAPTCNGAYDTGKKDVNNCELYACPPTPVCSKPVCEGIQDTGKKDEHGCTIYACPTPSCPQGCTCKEDLVTCPTQPAQPLQAQVTTASGESTLTFTKVSDESISINDGGSSATTTGTVLVQEKKLLLQTTTGNQEVKVLPAAASTIAVNQLKLKEYTVQLQDAGKPVYRIDGTKTVKVLGFITATMKTTTQLDAQTGAVISTQTPWWSALASG